MQPMAAPIQTHRKNGVVFCQVTDKGGQHTNGSQGWKKKKIYISKQDKHCSGQINYSWEIIYSVQLHVAQLY